ncbi:M15 family metallopeptidase [soil metagenome]
MARRTAFKFRRAALLPLLTIGFGGCAPVATRSATECSVPASTLVDVRSVDATIRTEIRYATPNNFTGRRLPGYETARALLRPVAAAALGRVQARLRAEGLGLKVWDAYRPVRATLAMVDWAERTGNQWVLDQGCLARQSGHNLGGTVDLTLVRLDTGQELEMGTAYDEFTERAHTANASGTVAANRQRLVRAMAAEGFANYEKEWWHFRRPGEYQPLDAPLACFPGA